MLDDLVVVIGIEEVGGDPFGLAVVDVLLRMKEDMLAIFNPSDDPNVSVRVSLDERFEELNETFDAVSHTG